VNNFRYKIHTFCLHLNLLEGGRKIQVNRLCDRIKSTVNDDSPIIIAGDFNDWRINISQRLEENMGLKDAYLGFHGTPARTFPSTSPLLCLDRIYYKKLELHNIETLKEKHWRKLSDHVALFAEFELCY